MARHVDTYVEPETRDVDELHTAKVTTTDDEQPVGVPVFFSVEEIERQGLDATNIDKLGVWVEDGCVVFVPVSPEVEAAE